MKFEDVFKQDMAAHYPPLTKWRFTYRIRYPILAWQRRLRKIEAFERNPRRNPILKAWYFVLKVLHKNDSIRLGFCIPPHTFGLGLSIAHWGTITVEGMARIGSNCRIHQGVTIGSAKGKVPTIGDNCLIGANALIIGGVEIGNNVKIGAGAVVTKSFGDTTVLVGNPAKNRLSGLNDDASQKFVAGGL